MTDRNRRTRIGVFIFFSLSSSAAWATEARNPPIFYNGSAGPYALRVSIHPPDVIPGLAKLRIETDELDLQRVRLVALPLDSAQAAFPPIPDRAERSASDPHELTGQLWLMSSGSWQVRILADGARGAGELSVPVPALPTHVASMPPDLGALLLGLLLLLSLGLISIVAAAVREGQLAPGEQPGGVQRSHARIAAWVAAGIVLALVLLGDRWWAASARAYARSVYRPLVLSAQLEADGQLKLMLDDPGWLASRKLDDLTAPDGHPMDLWVVELPDFGRVWHLHPEQVGTGVFEQALPAMPEGHYELFASVVHEDGLEETAQQELAIPETSGRALGPADSRGLGGPIGTAEAQVAALPNGGRLILKPESPLRTGRPSWLRFRVLNRQGQPEQGLQPLGRLATATIVSANLETFARLSTRGTVAQASWSIANPGAAEGAEDPTSELAFPYEFSRPGRYRIFIQVRIADQNEIAILDVRVL